MSFMGMCQLNRDFLREGSTYWLISLSATLVLFDSAFRLLWEIFFLVFYSADAGIFCKYNSFKTNPSKADTFT